MLIYPTIRNLRAFESVARLGSFGRAAEELCISPSALSQNIGQLEENLSIRLIDRTTRQMQLTAIGEQFYPRVLRWLTEIEETCEEIAQQGHLSSGHVRVATLTSLAIQYLPEALAELRQASPGTKVTIFDDVGATVERRVVETEADLGIAGGPVRSPEVEFTPLYDEPFHLLCHRNHRFAGRADGVCWEEIGADEFIGFSENTNIGKQLRHTPELESVLPQPWMEVSQLGTLWGLVRNGLGVAAVPSSACLDVENLSAVPLKHPIVTRQIGIVTMKGRSLSPQAKLFRSILMRLVASKTALTEIAAQNSILLHNK